MLKKFLAFIGLASVTLENGKANLTMTEEQMEASGKIIAERDDAIDNVARLHVELEEERQQNTTAQADVVKNKEEIAKLTAEVKRLKSLPGTISIENTDATDGKGEVSGHVVDDTKSFYENMDACRKAFGLVD